MRRKIIFLILSEIAALKEFEARSLEIVLCQALGD